MGAFGPLNQPKFQQTTEDIEFVSFRVASGAREEFFLVDDFCLTIRVSQD
jgi:hypothetical protein